MIWILFIFTLTCTLSWFGFNMGWAFFFSGIIWISVELEFPLWLWFFCEMFISFLFLKSYMTPTKSSCSSCNGCPCGSGSPCSPCNVLGGCQKQTVLPKQEESPKPEETVKQRKERRNNEFKGIIILWIVLFFWRLYIVLS